LSVLIPLERPARPILIGTGQMMPQAAPYDADENPNGVAVNAGRSDGSCDEVPEI
jgi:hypothetical protein